METVSAATTSTPCYPRESTVQRSGQISQTQLAAISTFVQENLSGISVIKSFVREKHQISRFRELNEDYVEKNLSFARVYAGFHPSLMLIIGIAVLLVLLGGGRLVISKTITIGEFTAFMLYLGMLVWHTGVEGTAKALIPPSQTCMNCHKSVRCLTAI